MRNLEQLQVTSGGPKSKRMAKLDAATEDQEVNPMVPGPDPQSLGISMPRPQPRLVSKLSEFSVQYGESPAIQPSFSLAAPGQQFSFRLPNTSHFEASEERSMSSSLSHWSTPLSTHASSNFSRCSSHVSTPQHLVPLLFAPPSKVVNLRNPRPAVILPISSYWLSLLSLVSRLLPSFLICQIWLAWKIPLVFLAHRARLNSLSVGALV